MDITDEDKKQIEELKAEFEPRSCKETKICLHEKTRPNMVPLTAYTRVNNTLISNMHAHSLNLGLSQLLWMKII